MKKVLIIFLSIVVVTIILTGTFSAGIVVGRYIQIPSLKSTPELVSNSENPSLSAPETEVPRITSPPDIKDTNDSEVSEPLLPPNHPTIIAPEVERIAPSNDLEELFTPFWETWDIVHDQFVDQPVNDEEMMRGAIDGMLESLGDQHTSYMDPEQFFEANIPLEGEYEGIGAWVDINSEYLTIVSPMRGSPAEKAGLIPGDEIIAVDGEDMTGIDGNLVRRHVIGPAGSVVVLTIKRAGVIKPFDVEITRERIFLPSVEYRMLDGNIAYVNILTFGDDTTRELRTGLEDLLDQEPRGLIVDLRNNGGGLLRTAIEVASEFIDEGVILYQVYGDGKRDIHEALGDGLATDIPMVVLINAGTASASEIVAGAIQDHGRAPLVGVTSFGKGSVQNWVPLSDDQGAVRVTIAKWLTPNERQIHQKGLDPDYILGVLTEAQIAGGHDADSLGLDEDQVIILTPEDVLDERDPQLEKAIEVLLNE